MGDTEFEHTAESLLRTFRQYRVITGAEARARVGAIAFPVLRQLTDLRLIRRLKWKHRDKHIFYEMTDLAERLSSDGLSNREVLAEAARRPTQYVTWVDLLASLCGFNNTPQP